MSSYKNQSINYSLIDNIVNKHCGNNPIIELSKVNKDLDKYTFRFDDKNTKTAFLFLHYNNDGTITIDYGKGKNQVFSQEIADKIIELASVKLPPINQLYFKTIDDEKFKYLIECLSIIGASIVDERDISNGKQYMIKGRQKENLSMIHYSNLAIHFQGKPSLLLNDIIDILIEIFPVDDVQKRLLEYYDIQRPEDDILSEFENLYPHLSKKLSDKLMAIISPSIELRKVTHNLSDYSYLTHPPLKGLEGVLKMIFSENGIIITNKEGFSDYFKFNNTKRKWECSTETMDAISCAKTQSYLAKMYAIYNSDRNTLFHVDSVNPTILNHEDALSIIDNTLNLLEEFFVQIKE